MAGNRTLKLSILADVDNLKKGLAEADGNVQGFGGKLENFAKTAGIAFAVAGAAAVAYAGKLAIDGVKAALEDEAAQVKLATTLKNVTGATHTQTAAVEAYILKTELAYGVTDTQLRPSLDRLIRSTKDVTEAQRLQTLALDIAAGTGKSLESVSNALAKAHDGNFAALKRLGVSIDESIIKSKNFDAATAVLANTFKDQASQQADTFEGKLRILQIAFDEGKETIGSFILDAITPIVNAIVNYVVPAVQSFIDSIGGAKGIKANISDFIELVKTIVIPIIDGLKYSFDKIKSAVADNKEEFDKLFKFIKDYVAPLLGGALKLAIEGIGTAFSVVIRVIGGLINAIETAYNAMKKLIDLVKNNPVAKFFGASSGVLGGPGTGLSVKNALYDPGVEGPTINLGVNQGLDIAALRKQLFGMTPKQQAEYERLKQETADIRARIEARKRGEISGSNTTITVNGAIDPVMTARQIANILNMEATTSGSFGRLGESYV